MEIIEVIGRFGPQRCVVAAVGGGGGGGGVGVIAVLIRATEIKLSVVLQFKFSSLCLQPGDKLSTAHCR